MFFIFSSTHVLISSIDIVFILFIWSNFDYPSLDSDALWWGQAQNGVNLEFKLNLTLKVNVDRPPKQ